VWQRKLIRFLLLPIGIIGTLVIVIIVPLNYTPDTSVPLPYIPPPEGHEGYYIETTIDQLTSAITSYGPWEPDTYKGKSFIFKNVNLNKYLMSGMTETYLIFSLVQFVAQNPSDLKELKVNDVVDIIGVCDGALAEHPDVIVIKNCYFLSPGLASLPLPGGPVFIIGY
jgi:hypothetical protein